MSPAPVDAHEWVSFEDPDEDRTWLIDVTFLTSPWQCIFGHGCQGVLTAPAAVLQQGCCSYGAHFSGEEDAARVEAAAATLTAEQWQFRSLAASTGTVRREGDELTTVLVEDACVFLNRPGFIGGAGCALHLAAMQRGVPHLDLKPDVCWQLPLRREDTTDDAGHVTSKVCEWNRKHWGEAGEEFAWWCTEAREAFGAGGPVYLNLADELRALCGAKIYTRMRAYLDERSASSVPLPHPVLRRRRSSGPRRESSAR